VEEVVGGGEVGRHPEEDALDRVPSGDRGALRRVFGEEVLPARLLEMLTELFPPLGRADGRPARRRLRGRLRFALGGGRRGAADAGCAGKQEKAEDRACGAHAVPDYQAWVPAASTATGA